MNTQKVIEKINDPIVRSFFKNEFSKYLYQFKGEALAPIQNKLGAFLSTPLIRNIVGQVNSKIDFNPFWYGALHDGVVRSNDNSNGIEDFNYSVTAELKNTKVKPDGITIQIKESYSLKDGRFANNGWLQEAPHPVSKVTWDNYAAISTLTAKQLKGTVQISSPQGLKYEVRFKA